MVTQFLSTLFEPWEKVCASETPFGTTIIPVHQLLECGSHAAYNFISINALAARRADNNVSSYRNILLEFDKGDLDTQKQAIKASKVPYTSMTFSGKKSIHVIISLETPLLTREEYDAVVRHLYSKFPDCDQKCKNPSRFSRMPGALRDGVEQQLIELHSRISNNLFFDWLGPVPEPQPQVPIYDNLAPDTEVSMYARRFLDGASKPGEWNNDLFRAAISLFKTGHTESQVVELVRDIHGRIDASDKRTIHSAKRNAQKE